MSDSDPYVIAWDEFRDRLAAAAREDADWYRQVAAGLARPGDRLALDIGCGGAGMSIALGDALPPGARVIGIDGNAEILASARQNVTNAGLGDDRVELRQFDLEAGPVALGKELGEPADVVWASGVVHHVGDQQAVVDGLAGLLAPGGRLALAEGGLRSQYLPWDAGVGEPGLELRLIAAQDAWFARMRAELPGSVRMPYGWTTALSRAGLTQVTTVSIMLEKPAPLGDADRKAVVSRLGMFAGRIRETGLLSADDVAAWERLLDETGPDWLGRRDDLFSLSVRSVHTGILEK
ncbi:methyltransferase [Flindersiella endophytica]